MQKSRADSLKGVNRRVWASRNKKNEDEEDNGKS